MVLSLFQISTADYRHNETVLYLNCILQNTYTSPKLVNMLIVKFHLGYSIQREGSLLDCRNCQLISWYYTALRTIWAGKLTLYTCSVVGRVTWYTDTSLSHGVTLGIQAWTCYTRWNIAVTMQLTV